MKNEKYCVFEDIPYYNDDIGFKKICNKLLDNEQLYQNVLEDILLSYYSTFFGKDIFNIKMKNNHILCVSIGKEIHNIRSESDELFHRFKTLELLKELRKKETILCEKFFSNKVLKEIRCCNSLTSNSKEISNEYIYTNILFQKLATKLNLEYQAKITFGFRTLLYVIEYLETNINKFEESILSEIRKLYFETEFLDLNDLYKKYIEEFEDFINENLTDNKELNFNEIIKLKCEDTKDIISTFKMYEVPSVFNHSKCSIINLYEFLEKYYKTFFNKILELKNIKSFSEKISIDKYYCDKFKNKEYLKIINSLFLNIVKKEQELYENFINDRSILTLIKNIEHYLLDMTMSFEEILTFNIYVKSLCEPIVLKNEPMDIENYPLEYLDTLFKKVEEYFYKNKNQVLENIFNLYSKKYDIGELDVIFFLNYERTFSPAYNLPLSYVSYPTPVVSVSSKTPVI